MKMEHILKEVIDNELTSVYFDAVCDLCHEVKMTHFFKLKDSRMICVDCLREIKRNLNLDLRSV